jgi:hypothetical protein
MYSALVLDETSQAKLAKWANDNVTINGVRLPILVQREGWKMFCHHMTIKYPGTPDFIEQFIDSDQKLEAIAVGVSDKAVAVRVVGFHSENKIPHITVAINVKGGGKPVMSNDIKDWKKIEKPIKLSGTVKELK